MAPLPAMSLAQKRSLPGLNCTIPGSSVDYSSHVSNPITICRNACIGLGVTMLGGVTIGEGPVIKSAQNAVLPKTHLLRSADYISDLCSSRDSLRPKSCNITAINIK